MQLSIAAVGLPRYADISYDILNVAQHVDFINLICQEFGGAWDGYLSHNAPLMGAGSNNVTAVVDYWLKNG